MFERLANTTIEWKRSESGERTYELKAGRDVLATLRRESWLGTIATATAGAYAWTFRRAGMFRGRVIVRSLRSELGDATFQPGWTGAGDVIFESGRTFSWRRPGMLSPEWAFTDEVKRRLMLFTPGLTGSRADVHLSPLGARAPEAPLLAALGWYLVMLMSNDPDWDSVLPGEPVATMAR
jgi:hypothetical protein